MTNAAQQYDPWGVSGNELYPGANPENPPWLMGYESVEEVTLFSGDDYALVELEYPVGFGWFGSKIAKSVVKVVSAPVKVAAKVTMAPVNLAKKVPVVGSVVKKADHFASNAVKVAGKPIGAVTKGIQTVTGAVSKEIGKIPVIGGPLHTVLDAGFSLGMAPVNLAVAVAIDGKRIDQAVLNNLKQQLHDFKQVAPYAQMVISVVPGVGQGVSAALASGLALAEGQSIADVLKAGAIGAIPGGPLVKAAVTMATETIQAAATGKPINLQTFASTAGGVASSALGLPVAAKNALVAGVATIGAIAKGAPLDKAMTDAAVNSLPLSADAKKAMTDGSQLAIDLAKGKKIDAALTSRVNGIIARLPATNPLHIALKTGLETARKAPPGQQEKTLAAAVHSGIGDALVSMGAQSLPADAQKGIKAGAALGAGKVFQSIRGPAVLKVTGKLIESGVQLSKASPVIAEARKLATTQGATQGFDHATGLLQQQVGLHDISVVRNALPANQKIGFDMAVAVRVGAVANPKPATTSPAAHAGNAIALGMQSYDPNKKAAIMSTVQTNPSAAVGATVAVKEVAAKRESFIVKVLRLFKLHK